MTQQTTGNVSSEAARIKLADLTLDAPLQMRPALNPATVERYAALMRDGIEFDPIDVWEISSGERVGQIVVTDGYHRIAAAQQAGIEELPARRTFGSFEAALWAAIPANAMYRENRDAATIRNAVAAALLHPFSAGMSDRAIAKRVGCSHPTVADVAADLVTAGKLVRSDVRTTANGRQINTSNIGGSPRVPEPPRPAPKAQQKQESPAQLIQVTWDPNYDNCVGWIKLPSTAHIEAWNQRWEATYWSYLVQTAHLRNVTGAPRLLAIATVDGFLFRGDNAERAGKLLNIATRQIDGIVQLFIYRPDRDDTRHCREIFALAHSMPVLVYEDLRLALADFVSKHLLNGLDALPTQPEPEQPTADASPAALEPIPHGAWVMFADSREMGLVIGVDDARCLVKRETGAGGGYINNWTPRHILIYPCHQPEGWARSSHLWRWHNALIVAYKLSIAYKTWYPLGKFNSNLDICHDLIKAQYIETIEPGTPDQKIRISEQGCTWLGLPAVEYTTPAGEHESTLLEVWSYAEGIQQQLNLLLEHAPDMSNELWDLLEPFARRLGELLTP
jgi:hypothetical protein